MTPNLALRLNAAGLFAVCVVLGFAFADQLLFHDLPCPLCLLQRAGMVAAGFGIALNLALGLRTTHYAFTLLGAVAGAAIAMRQVLLHIVPGTGSYGDPFLGLHFYTWAFLVFSAMIVGCAVMLLFDEQFKTEATPGLATRRLDAAVFLLFVLLVVGNAFSTIAECGGGLCPDNPTTYQFFR